MSLEPAARATAVNPLSGKMATTIRPTAKMRAARVPDDLVEAGRVGLAHEWLHDGSLSLKARGILALLYTYPDGHLVTLPELMAFNINGRDYLMSGLRELAEGGWIEDVYIKAPIPPELRMAVLRRDGYRCVVCDADADLMADHVIPERRGGATTFDNLQTMCRPCNSHKGSSLPGE